MTDTFMFLNDGKPDMLHFRDMRRTIAAPVIDHHDIGIEQAAFVQHLTQPLAAIMAWNEDKGVIHNVYALLEWAGTGNGKHRQELFGQTGHSSMDRPPAGHRCGIHRL